MLGREWRTVPYLARQYRLSDHRQLYARYDDYYNDNISGSPQNGDVEAIPVRCYEDDKTVRAKDEDPTYSCLWYPSFASSFAMGNQQLQDEGIIYERHNKGIPMLQIWYVKLKYGSKDHVKYSWKLDEVTKDCMLEIDQSYKNEQGKKNVKFPFATNDTDKLVSQLVDGYEVKYMLHTDAIRLRLELVIVLSTLDTKLDFSNLHTEVKLEIEPGREPYTLIRGDQHLSKKPKLDQSDTFTLSITRIIPRNLRPWMKLVVALKDSARMLDVKGHCRIFPYNIPVDQNDYIHFKNGYIRLNTFWGCCLCAGKGVCTGVCTCEPYDFIGFPSPSEVSCCRADEE